jgi:hypothetical protein
VLAVKKQYHPAASTCLIAVHPPSSIVAITPVIVR